MSGQEHCSEKPPAFLTERDRDAWAVIRGFVYQVDLTITRWLALKPGQTLELECGEDIDLISHSLTVPSEEQMRLLEQVKHRTRPVTLRAPSAVASLACALEHRNANPQLHLEFQYTTNAQITVERVSLIKPTGPALVMWEELRRGILSAAVQPRYLSHIRAILATIECPKGLNNMTWTAFLSPVGSKGTTLGRNRSLLVVQNPPPGVSV